MSPKTVADPNVRMPDLAHLIRSVQRLEGNPDCFGTAYQNCDRKDCAWREYCLKEAEKGIADKPNTKA